VATVLDDFEFPGKCELTLWSKTANLVGQVVVLVKGSD
jgi:hypothetical protein